METFFYLSGGDQSFSKGDYNLSALVKTSYKQSKKQCIFCNLKNHKSYKCLRVTEPAARKEMLKQNKNCFIRFEFGHVTKNDNWEYKYKKRNGKLNVPFPITKEIYSIQMTKIVKILAQLAFLLKLQS